MTEEISEKIFHFLEELMEEYEMNEIQLDICVSDALGMIFTKGLYEAWNKQEHKLPWID